MQTSSKQNEVEAQDLRELGQGELIQKEANLIFGYRDSTNNQVRALNPFQDIETPPKEIKTHYVTTLLDLSEDKLL